MPDTEDLTPAIPASDASEATPGAISPEAVTQGTAPAAEQPGTGAEPPASQAPVEPTFDPEAWKNNPQFRSYLNKEQAAAEKRAEQRVQDQANQRAAIAEQQRLANERAEKLARAYAGDQTAKDEIINDDYVRLYQSQQQNAAYAQLAQEADASVYKLTKGDPEAMNRLDIRKFKTVSEWDEAKIEYAAGQRAGVLAEQQAEAIAATKLSQIRGVQPNPDTAEQVGGAGRGTYKSQTDLEARYVALKQDGDFEEAQKLRQFMHSREYAALPRNAA